MVVVGITVSIFPPNTSAGSYRRSPVKISSSLDRGGKVSRNQTAFETRITLVLALASQAFLQTQRVIGDLVAETAKYAIPRRFEPRNLEEALMAVPDLETVNFRVVKQTEQYLIREVEPYFVAETTLAGSNGFDFNGASQAFNVLAEYLFGKAVFALEKLKEIRRQCFSYDSLLKPSNTLSEQMEMTTPVYTRKVQSNGERMKMKTPVITKQDISQSGEKWQMSFVMPGKYGANLPLPKDPSVRIKEVPAKIVAVTAFSGFVSDEIVKSRESKLRDALKNDSQFQVKRDAMIEVAQFNPPFTLPFTRRNEISLEVERKAK